MGDIRDEAIERHEARRRAECHPDPSGPLHSATGPGCPTHGARSCDCADVLQQFTQKFMKPSVHKLLANQARELRRRADRLETLARCLPEEMHPEALQELYDIIDGRKF